MAENDILIGEVKELTTNVKQLIPKAEAAEKTANETSAKQKELHAELQKLNADTVEFKAWREQATKDAAENQKAVDSLITEVKTMREGGMRIQQPGAGLDFISSCAKAIGEKAKEIAGVSKKSGLQIELKEGTHMFKASNMTTATDLTGSPNITYIPTPVILPRQLINFRDLIPSFQSQTGLINLFRENGSTSPQVGSFGQQLTEGTTKNQVEYQFTNVAFTAEYVNGFVRISKQMLQDVLFLQSYLPQMLLRDYFKEENSLFYTAQSTAALGSNITSGGNDAEKFIDYITNLEGTNFAPNAIVTTPAIWGKIMKTIVPTTGTAYSVPGGFYINPATGMVEIAGIPIIKATWIASGAALVADWNQSQIATVDNLKVEFFEQDSDNVQRNLITVRCEARVVLITAQPYAFVSATGL